jgi:5-methyltetrahydrofolate--homocysteine methyltransferase
MKKNKPLDFRKEIKRRLLVLDGAKGTMLQELGLPPGGLPEELNISRPELVAKVHRAYLEAGAEIMVTNSFGGNRVKLSQYGLTGKLEEINRKSVEIAREAIGKENSLVSASIGPTGKFVEPLGDLTFTEAVEIFTEQARALLAGGADLFHLETFLDIRELKAAVIAVRSLTRKPLVAMLTFSEVDRSVLGTPPEAAAIVLDSLGVDVIGSNCGHGPKDLLEILRRMSSFTHRPLIFQANAGLPALKNGATVYPAAPEEMAAVVPEAFALGVRVFGGCCGTDPRHIQKIAEAVKKLKSPAGSRRVVSGLKLASRTRFLAIGRDQAPLLAGSRINPTGKKLLSEELAREEFNEVRQEARKQEEEGADLLDVNVGIKGSTDHSRLMEKAVFAVNQASTLPVLIDSPDPRVIEAGLRAVDGKALINSTSADRARLSEIQKLARRYGAAVVGITLDGKGIPEKPDGRLRLARRIKSYFRRHGFPAEDLIIDPVVLTVSAAPEGPQATLKSLSLIRTRLRLPVILGVDNVSFGLPERPTLNAHFLAMVLAQGAEVFFGNPASRETRGALAAARLLLGQDPAAGRYLRFFSGTREETKTPDIFYRYLASGEKDRLNEEVKRLIGSGSEPLKVVEEKLLPAMKELGDRFGRNEIFLPQVMLAAEAMASALEMVEKHLPAEKTARKRKIILATVEGDIHDLGKNLVGAVLKANGFQVIDLGKSVPAKKILDAARSEKAEVVGLSALMTTTMGRMEEVVKLLREQGVKAITAVGGAVVNDEYARKIGADIYAQDAIAASERIKASLNK